MWSDLRPQLEEERMREGLQAAAGNNPGAVNVEDERGRCQAACSQGLF